MVVQSAGTNLQKAAGKQCWSMEGSIGYLAVISVSRRGSWHADGGFIIDIVTIIARKEKADAKAKRQYEKEVLA